MCQVLGHPSPAPADSGVAFNAEKNVGGMERNIFHYLVSLKKLIVFPIILTNKKEVMTYLCKIFSLLEQSLRLQVQESGERLRID